MTNVLSFDKGAWDDRELINAYDASLLEFHIHNPGPGSWLDKATAALAKGQPLPGATAYGSSWYSASKPLEKETRIKKRKKNPSMANGSARSTPAPNPYGASTSTSTPSGQLERAASPTYRPASPGQADGDDEEAEAEAEADADGPQPDEGEGAEEEGDAGGYDEEEWPGYEGGEQEWEQPDTTANGAVPQAEPPADAGLAYPPPRGHWDSAPVSRETALGYALNAQYWAGYWMGVARYAPAEEAQEPPTKKQKRVLRR